MSDFKIYEEFSQAFAIFASYQPDATWGVLAEYMIIYACDIPPVEMKQEDANKLKSFGWTWNNEFQSWQFKIEGGMSNEQES